ncbi:MAG TPA: hypothetical protein VM888_12480 [Chitinophagaceae bacterium]|nr:hypothetical protein [Chitinophagaceae bacterium]
MKTSLFIVLFFFCFYSFGQSSSVKTIHFKILNGEGNYPSVIDTITINKKGNGLKESILNTPVIKDSFSINELEMGRYTIYGVAKNYFLYPIPIAVCSKCSDAHTIIGTVMKEGDGRNFSMIEISPSYSGGYQSLSKDFYKALSKKERKIIKSFKSDVTISFFVTKEKEVSDIVFSNYLTQEIKNIFIKGLTSAKNWLPALVNGRTMDDLYAIKSIDLL